MAAILIADLTEAIVDGTGAFDIIMKAINAHLEKQYDEQRIPASDFAKIYLQAMESGLSQAIAFILSQQKADKDADLVTEQITLVTQQVINAVQENLKLIAETSLIGAQEFKLAGVDSTLVTSQDQKVAKEELLVVQNTANALATASIIPKQGDKLVQEKLLLLQKTYSEEAQILDTVNALPVVGVIGKQKELFIAQIDGFARDAEQKLAKIVVDAWGVRSAVKPENLTSPAGIADGDVTAVMAVAQTGIGL